MNGNVILRYTRNHVRRAHVMCFPASTTIVRNGLCQKRSDLLTECIYLHYIRYMSADQDTLQLPRPLMMGREQNTYLVLMMMFCGIFNDLCEHILVFMFSCGGIVLFALLVNIQHEKSQAIHPVICTVVIVTDIYFAPFLPWF